MPASSVRVPVPPDIDKAHAAAVPILAPPATYLDAEEILRRKFTRPILDSFELAVYVDTQGTCPIERKPQEPLAAHGAPTGQSAASPQQNLRHLEPTATPNAMTAAFVARPTQLEGANAQVVS
jgi:hypothetical protein